MHCRGGFPHIGKPPLTVFGLELGVMDSLNTGAMECETHSTGKESLNERSSSSVKHSYTVPCASAFRDAAEALAHKRRVNVGDIARSILLVMPQSVIDGYPDPGEPLPDDRETVILKSGPALGRPWRRKPRIQVRMAPGYSIEQIRKALGIALAIESGVVQPQLLPPGYVYQAVAPETQKEPDKTTMKNATVPAEPAAVQPTMTVAEAFSEQTAPLREEVERLKAIVNVLSFDPLPGGVATADEALHVLGFPPRSRPKLQDVKARFRILATIHHPDSSHGNHQRMSQINQAMTILRTTVL